MENNLLLSQFSNDDFKLRTQQQIAKDFAKSNLNFPESFKITPWETESIYVIVQEKLYEIMRWGETQLMQLLYTIDLPEQKFLQLTQETDFIVKLSFALVEREAMKVYLRSKF